MESSKIIIGVMIFIGFIVIAQNLLIDQWIQYPDNEFNSTILNNYTGRYFGNVTSTWIGSQENLENSTFIREPGQDQTDSILVNPVRGLSYFWDSLSITNEILQDVSKDLGLPANLVTWFIVLLLMIFTIGIISILMRTKV